MIKVTTNLPCIKGLAILTAVSFGILTYWTLTPQGNLIASSIAVSVAAAVLWITEAFPLLL
jgi:hypothetical protein